MKLYRKWTNKLDYERTRTYGLLVLLTLCSWPEHYNTLSKSFIMITYTHTHKHTLIGTYQFLLLLLTGVRKTKLSSNEQHLLINIIIISIIIIVIIRWNLYTCMEIFITCIEIGDLTVMCDVVLYILLLLLVVVIQSFSQWWMIEHTYIESIKCL